MPKPSIRVVSAAIQSGDRYLITQRQDKAVLPLLWEFPGGKVEDGESDDRALVRELKERLGVEAKVGDLISTTEREYAKYVVTLHLYYCEIRGEARPLKVRDLKWVTSRDFSKYEFTPADEASMDALLFDRRALVR